MKETDRLHKLSVELTLQLCEEKDTNKYLTDLKVDNEKSIQKLKQELLESQKLRENETIYLKRELEKRKQELEKCRQEKKDLHIEHLNVKEDCRYLQSELTGVSKFFHTVYILNFQI
jgi:hypothetical protein